MDFLVDKKLLQFFTRLPENGFYVCEQKEFSYQGKYFLETYSPLRCVTENLTVKENDVKKKKI